MPQQFIACVRIFRGLCIRLLGWALSYYQLEPFLEADFFCSSSGINGNAVHHLHGYILDPQLFGT